jgi:endonuclease/exonuclease/phosphatase (EEP) superfamily protein YafD
LRTRSQRFVDGLLRRAGVLALLSLVPLVLGSVHWVLELGTVLTLHCLVVLAAAALLAAVLRRARTAAILGTIAAVHGVFALSVAAERRAEPQQDAVTILVANVYTANTDYQKLAALIAKTHPHVVGLVEVNAAWLEALAPHLMKYPYRYSIPREDNFGIALASRIPLDQLREDSYGPVPTLSAVLRLSGLRVRLVLTHVLPPISTDYVEFRDLQLRRMAKAIRRDGMPTLIVGDFNATPFSAIFREAQSESGLHAVDSFQGSWPTFWPALLRVPIDQVLASPALRVSRRLGPDIGSDHLPVLVRAGR